MERENPTNRVFVSYRREDSAGHAGRLADHLLDRFGSGSVFMDVESIEAGVDFAHAIERAIDGADAVLVVIGPGWLNSTSSSGSRRLDETGDFVRRELEAAIASEVRVIPVLVGGASMPTEDLLPPTIAELARRNAVELQDRRWREDVDALVDVLEGRGRGSLGNLPLQPTPFLGRTRELAEVVELLRRDDVRVLTLTGPGGTGKTRLAIQSAAKLAHIYPGGAWFVGLAPLTDPDLMLAEVGAVLDVQGGGNGSLVKALAARLSRLRTLVVLDNLEQLLPSVADPISELSAAAPSLDVVVSSREPLRVAAEREYPVGTLHDDDAVMLFVERARAIRPDFDLHDDADRQAIAAICDRLDRLPLAIELAAARVKLLPPAHLLDRLEQRLPLLTGGSRDAPERHRTLRATIAWSVDLLAEEERDLFERLAVFSGGWSLEAAEAVCETDADRMQALVERNLIWRDGERLTMLETIREFALERLDQRSDADDVRRAHARYLLTLADAVWEGIKGTDQQHWIHTLREDLDNFRKALAWSLDGGDPDVALRILIGISYIWYAGAPISEGRRWLERTLARSSQAATETRAWALEWAGSLAGEQGDRASAAALLEECIRCGKEADAIGPQAMAMSHLSGVVPLDRSDEKVPLAREAARLARGTGDRWLMRATLNNLGETLREVGDVPEALEAYEEALTLYRELGHAAGTALVLTNLAELAVVTGALARADALAAEAMELGERFENDAGIGAAQAVHGWVALAEERSGDASSRFRESLRLIHETGHLVSVPSLLFGLAGTAAAEGDTMRSARLAAAASRGVDVLGHAPSAADSNIHLRYLNQVRVATEPDVWEAEARAGEAMGLDEAISYALSSRDALGPADGRVERGHRGTLPRT